MQTSNNLTHENTVYKTYYWHPPQILLVSTFGSTLANPCLDRPLLVVFHGKRMATVEESKGAQKHTKTIPESSGAGKGGWPTRAQKN